MNTLFLLAAEGPNGKFIPSDPKELYFGAAAFAIVVVLMVTKLAPVISKALGAKGDQVREDLAAADAAQAAADAEIAALASKLGNADAEAAKIVADAEAAAAKLKVDLAAKAESDAAALRRKAASDVEGMRAQAAADLQAEISVQAMSVAEELAKSNLDDATHSSLIDQYIDQVGAQS